VRRNIQIQYETAMMPLFFKGEIWVKCKEQ